MDEGFNEGSPYHLRRMCEVCHARLNRRVNPSTGETTYLHLAGANHDPVPVMEAAQEDVIFVCDFCLEPHPVWNFGCSNFVDINTVTMDTNKDIGASLGDWAACTPCKELVVADKWDALADRSIQGQIARNPDAAAAYAASPAIMFMNRMGMMQLHQQFNEARTGPPQAIAQATWIADKLRDYLGEQED